LFACSHGSSFYVIKHYAKSQNGKFFDLKQDQMELLTIAMKGYSYGDLNSNLLGCRSIGSRTYGDQAFGEFLSATAESYIEMAYEWSVSGVKPEKLLPSSRLNL
jgi:hypothetical protein